jgi:chaperone required for assembly of F1-ATPase
MPENFLDSLLGPVAERPNPMEAARRHAKRALPKRFWREAEAAEREGGFALALDGKLARTPGRNELLVPDRDLAEAIAAEWRALGEEVDAARMPLTRLVFAAIDAVALSPGPVAAEIVKYAGSDLLCYREAGNGRLAQRQAAHWDPPLAHVREVHGARFNLAAGVVFTEQPPEALAAMARAVAQWDEPLGLAALHSATTLSGSAILALALAGGFLSADKAWAAAHVDEDFQIEVWGEDEEAMRQRAARRAEFDAAALVLASTKRGANIASSE